MKLSPLSKSLLILAVLALLMYTLNTWMPLHRDDYEYSLIWNTNQHLASLQDVFTSLHRHYLLHGGRMFSYFLLDVLLILGKPLFDIINTLVFAGLVVLIYFHARRSLEFGGEPAILGITAALAWLCFPHFGEVVVWMDGAITYLWTGFTAALFLLPYNLHLAGRPVRSRWLTLLMLPLGICAGWSVENLAVTVTLLPFAISIYSWRRRQMRLWMPIGAVGALAGAIGLIAAPGNFVRYGEGGTEKSFLLHIGNQFAGNGEMLLYILPALLLVLLCWRLLRAALAKKRGIALPAPAAKNSYTRWLLLAVILALVVSYFNGAFIAGGIRDFLTAHVLVPLHLDKPKTISHFANLMAGFEEMMIYWMSIFFVYSLLKQALGLQKQRLHCLKGRLRARDLWTAYPVIRYSAAMFGLALFNNFVMIAAPSFPARATFSAVIMILIGTIALLRDSTIQKALFANRQAAHTLQLGGLAIVLFIAAASLTVMHTLRIENDARIALVQEAARLPNAQEVIVTMPPIELKNRALRHIFFEDFDNGVTKGGLCRYYGIKDIKVER